ncbi:MAG: hypothetical protein JWM10_4802 [Myxococcaceae bacterium]|nr:hypothetical protein [Myxococcaceae bacterium]
MPSAPSRRPFAPLLRRASGLARRAAGLFPFTGLGLLLVAGSAWALVRYGIQHIDLLILVVGTVGLALGLTTLLSTSLTALVLWRRGREQRDEEALRLECGYAARTGFSMSNLWYVPFVKLRWTWDLPEASVRLVPLKRRLHEEVTPLRRGLHESIARRVEVSDAFGLTKLSFTLRQERVVRFVPSMGALRQMRVVRSIAGGDEISNPAGPPEGERVDLRHYAPGDPIKFVLWKVFARSRQLVVRTPERAIAPTRQTVAYLVTGAGDESAAGAARVAVDTGALGAEWVLGADGNDTYAKSPVQALEVLARSANTPLALGGAGLGDFLSRATPGGLARAVVFVPGRPGPWLDRVVATVRARTAPNQMQSPVEFVVCTDGIVPIAKSTWWSRLAFVVRPVVADGAVTPAPGDEVAAVLRALATTRAPVTLVDRVAGRVYPGGHHRSLEAA